MSALEPLEPLETLYASERGSAAPLPDALSALYGRLAFPPHTGRPYKWFRNAEQMP